MNFDYSSRSNLSLNCIRVSDIQCQHTQKNTKI